MVRDRASVFVLLAIVAIAVAMELLPVGASAQARDRSQPRPLIAVDGVVLQGGTTADQEAVLRMIRPAIESVEVLKGAAAAERFGAVAVDGAIVVQLKSEFLHTDRGGANRDLAIPTSRADGPLLIIDDVIVPNGLMRSIEPQNIERIEVLKGPAALEQFGERGRAGVIQVTTRPTRLH